MGMIIANFSFPCSGDHDMIITYISVEQWINSLELTIDSDWRPWFVDGQIAG